MSAPRAVRIPRAAAPSSVPSATVRAEPVGAPQGERRANRAGTQRGVRLTAVYLLVLAAIYLSFLFYARSAPGGVGPGVTAGLLTFSGIAVLLGVAGAVLTLSPVPRAVVVRPDGFAIIGRWGRRTEWSPLADVTILRVRRYPAGLLSNETVDSVEVLGPDRRRRSYLVETGLLPEPPAGPPRE